jgi:hypothetical protein
MDIFFKLFQQIEKRCLDIPALMPNIDACRVKLLNMWSLCICAAFLLSLNRDEAVLN